MAGLVSVIVPIFNTEKYLRRCVDSVLTQTYPNLELILINDGSTDSSGELIDQIAMMDARVRVVHQVNSGVSVARNNGVLISNGDYVYFLDSDDWLEREMIESCVRAINENELDVVFFGVNVHYDGVSDHSVKVDLPSSVSGRIL